MVDLGLMHKFLAVQFLQTTTEIFLHQAEYAQSIIDDYSLPHITAHVPTPKLTRLQKDTATPLQKDTATRLQKDTANYTT